MANNLTSVADVQSLQKLLKCQMDFQELLHNDMPTDIVKFSHVRTALEHNTYQQIEFQEFMEANQYEKKEELIDYLLFLLNKYIFLGVNLSDLNIEDALWGTEESYSSAAASCYASIEQFEFIKLIREHCIFKPWKVHSGENCVDYKYVYDGFNRALGHFRALARMTYDNFYDLHTCLVKKLMINLARQGIKADLTRA